MTDPLESLNISGRGVDTSYPLLEEADYEFQIVESTVVPNKAQSGFNWRMKLALTEPGKAVGGGTIAVNSPVFHLRALQPSDQAEDKEAYKKGIFADVDAIFGTNESNRPDLNRATVEGSVGKRVKARIIIDEYQGNKSNKVKKLLPA